MKAIIKVYQGSKVLSEKECEYNKAIQVMSNIFVNDLFGNKNYNVIFDNGRSFIGKIFGYGVKVSLINY